MNSPGLYCPTCMTNLCMNFEQFYLLEWNLIFASAYIWAVMEEADLTTPAHAS